ncbi:DNA repair endonuclease rad2 [Fusarium beomiforme]|uniref:DNA repair endonuclease rad2 n=1 Tax=Fusarium beomiforme TaxID=44412 RepID=A0A9P5E1S8_9HYPO|nr:DNA repair endonuclease rad2 [Fusarium beomiforme]
MGIKGIYQEVGEGERVALLKLAAESLEKHGRPLRIAIDIAIWQFQNQAAQGGTNPEIRTLFYRLVRLLACPVEPIFVFDGPYKPAVKRNKKSGRGDSFANAQAKRLIRLFGCNTHDAPGEAEAECALLQKHGIVDMVLTEDVDALMFGCTKMVRQWSPASKRDTTPTHVSLFDTEKMKLDQHGLDREGMVLVALMSGGDYDPNGLPGCGIKVAVEAAKAGFGKDLCRLKAVDKEGAAAWRNSLIHELRTNEKGHFKRKNKALTIPDTFPDFKILRFYTHPVVSPEENIDEIREKVHLKREIQFEDLREFTREVFGWDYRVGALKFIKVLSHAVLVQKMQALAHHEPTDYIKGIAGFRSDLKNDLVSQVRIQHIPSEIIPIDLSKEEDEKIVQGRGGLALNSDEEIEDAENIEDSTAKRQPAPYNPSARQGVWALEILAKLRIPEVFADAQVSQKTVEKKKQQAKEPKTRTRSKAGPKTGMPTGALNKFVRASKPHTASTVSSKGSSKEKEVITSPIRSTTSRRLRLPSPLEPSKQPTSTTGSTVRQTTTPWTLASLQVTPRTRKPADEQQAIIITSSPPCAADSPPPSPSPRPRTRVPASHELLGTMHAISSSSGSPQRLKDSTQNVRRTRPPISSQTSQPPKMKQMSMDMFTKKSKSTSSSQTSATKSPLPPPRQSLPSSQTRFDDDFDSDSSTDLAPLSSLISRPSASPNKQQQSSLPPDRNTTPSPAPVRKKKLLIPRASAVGFYEEVEVEAEERDELLARETAALERRGVQAKVFRTSDIGFIDLTQDD